MEPVWEMLVEYRADLLRLCKTYGRRIRKGPEDLFTDVCVEKFPQVWAAWDPSKGEWGMYLRGSMRWYLHKHVRRMRVGLKGSHVGLKPQHEPRTGPPDHSSADQVAEVLSRLTPQEALLLRWHLLEGYSFVEIGAYLGEDRRQVAREYHAALRAARTSMEDDPG